MLYYSGALINNLNPPNAGEEWGVWVGEFELYLNSNIIWKQVIINLHHV